MTTSVPQRNVDKFLNPFDLFKGFFYLCNMEDNERIQELEGEIFDLKSELRECVDKERIYQEILSEINDSIDNLFQREEENERFRFDDKVDFRQYVMNLKNDLNEYRRVYGNIVF